MIESLNRLPMNAFIYGELFEVLSLNVEPRPSNEYVTLYTVTIKMGIDDYYISGQLSFDEEMLIENHLVFSFEKVS